MSPIQNARILFRQPAVGLPEPGVTITYDSSQTIDLDAVPLEGGFLAKTLLLSVDPYLRNLMCTPEDSQSPIRFNPGDTLYTYGISVVLRSENENVKPGDRVYGFFFHQEYNVIKDFTGFKVIHNERNLPWSVYLGVAGMPGLTGYYGWKTFSNAKKGDIVFVSAAASAIGSLVVQLAKAEGLRVIGSAGSDEKVKFLKEIGVDVPFNYKTTDTRQILEEHGPIDIYWDNVGGSTLETVIDTVNIHGRLILCGFVSEYNDKGYPIRNLLKVINKSVKLFGFNVFEDAGGVADEFNTFISEQLSSGKLHYVEHQINGLDKVGDALLAVLSSKAAGKAVVVVAEE